MAVNMLDRRVRRTRRMLKDGLAQLLKEKPFSEITARNITDRMDLNRATFYLHYKSTFELLQDLEEDLLEEVQKMIDEERAENSEPDSLAGLFEKMIDFVVDNHGICETLFLNNASSDFTGKLRDFVYRNGEEFLGKRHPEADPKIVGYALSYMALGLVGLMMHWLESGQEIPKATLVQIGERLMFTAEDSFFAAMEEK